MPVADKLPNLAWGEEEPSSDGKGKAEMENDMPPPPRLEGARAFAIEFVDKAGKIMSKHWGSRVDEKGKSIRSAKAAMRFLPGATCASMECGQPAGELA